MEPTIEQLSKQHATIINEVNTLESRVTQLRTDATRIEGVVMYLNQQAQASQASAAPFEASAAPFEAPEETEDIEDDLTTTETPEP